MVGLDFHRNNSKIRVYIVIKWPPHYIINLFTYLENAQENHSFEIRTQMHKQQIVSIFPIKLYPF